MVAFTNLPPPPSSSFFPRPDSIASHFLCLFFCASHYFVSVLCLLFDTEAPFASTAVIPFSSHTVSCFESLDITNGSPLESLCISFSFAVAFTSLCSLALAFTFAVLVLASSAQAATRGLSRGCTKAYWQLASNGLRGRGVNFPEICIAELVEKGEQALY